MKRKGTIKLKYGFESIGNPYDIIEGKEMVFVRILNDIVYDLGGHLL